MQMDVHRQILDLSSSETVSRRHLPEGGLFFPIQTTFWKLELTVLWWHITVLCAGCNGFFFMRNSPYINTFLDDLAGLFQQYKWHDQEAFSHMARDWSNYIRFLDVHPRHDRSYLYKKKHEPQVLLKYLPQVQFINGHALRYYPPPKGTRFYIIHTNGIIGNNKESYFRKLNAWFLDDKDNCITWGL